MSIFPENNTLTSSVPGSFSSIFGNNNVCLLCNANVCENVLPNNSLEDKQLFCKIFQVFPPSFSLENDLFNDKLFGIFCQICSFNVAELCDLERQMCNLRARIDQMQMKMAHCVVNSFAKTSCNQNGYIVKQQIYEKWFERCHQVLPNVWESTPLPMPAQCPVAVSIPESEAVSVEVLPSVFDIRLIPVEKIVENVDDDNSSIAGNFAPSPPPDEDSNVSIEKVHSPNKPVLPLPCVTKQMKRAKPNHRSQKKTSGKKKQVKLKSNTLLDANKYSNIISEENVTAVNREKSSSPGPPPLSPMCNSDNIVEEVIAPTKVDKANDNVKQIVSKSKNKKSFKRRSAASARKTKKRKPGPPKMDPDRFTCTFCQKKFSQKCNFDAHVRLHTGEKPFKCRFCERAYASQGNKINHEKSHDKTRYEGEPKYSCDLCDKKYYVESALTVHKYRRHNEKFSEKNVAKCEFCDATVLDMKYHVEKLHTVSEKKPFKCPICHFTFSDDLYLQKHHSVHTLAELLYQCKVCKRGYNHRFKMNEHLRAVHKITDLASQISEILVVPAKECITGRPTTKKKEKVIKPKRERRKRSNNEVALVRKKYPRSSKEFMCEICGKISKENYSHLAHLRTHTGEKPFKCKYCDRRFNDSGNRLKHQRTHDKSRLEGEPQFECKECGKKFHLMGTLYHHSRRRHAKIVPKYYRPKDCNICGATLANSESLLQHKKRLHLTTKYSRGLQQLQCTTCLQMFASEYRLKIHKLEHMKEIECQEFKCYHCPPLSHELFSKEDLYKHYKLVHDDVKEEDIVTKKTFRCPKCPLTYFLLKSVLEHINQVHEKPKGSQRRNNKRKKHKLKIEYESESDDELIIENLKHENSTKIYKVELKEKPLVKSTRYSTRQLATPAKIAVKSENKDLLVQCKDLRICLTRIDEEYEEIEIKEESIDYFK